MNDGDYRNRKPSASFRGRRQIMGVNPNSCETPLNARRMPQTTRDTRKPLVLRHNRRPDFCRSRHEAAAHRRQPHAVALAREDAGAGGVRARRRAGRRRGRPTAAHQSLRRDPARPESAEAVGQERAAPFAPARRRDAGADPDRERFDRRKSGTARRRRGRLPRQAVRSARAGRARSRWRSGGSRRRRRAKWCAAISRSTSTRASSR